MSRTGTHWKRHEVYGTPERVEISAESLKAARDAGCDTYAPNSHAAIFGVTTLSYLDEQVIPRAIAELGAHFVELRDAGGKHIGWATHVNSAYCAATMWHWYTTFVQEANLPSGHLFRVVDQR